MKGKGLAFYELVKEVYFKFGRDHGSFLAATISYYALFSIFPLLLVLISVAGFFFAQAETTRAVLNYTRHIIPQFSVVVRENIQTVAASRSQVGLIGIAGLLWSGTAVFDALEYALDQVFGEAETKPLFRAKLLGIAAVIGLITILVVITLVTPVVGAARDFWLRTPLGRSLILSYDSYIWLISMGVATVVFLALYHLVPSRRPSVREIWPGAVVAGLTWEAAKRLFSWYLRRAAKFSAVYGSLGIVIGLLVWLYILGIIIVFGGELAAVITARRERSLS